MILTSRHHIKPDNDIFKDCYDLCRAMRILRNTCLYHIRNTYFSTNNLYITNNDKKEYIFNHVYLYHLFKNTIQYRTKDNPEIDNRYINTKILKQVYRNINNEFSSFYKALKSYIKEPKKFLGKPKIPNYSKELYVTTVPKEALSFKNKGYVKVASSNIMISIGNITKNQIKEVKIVPLSYGFDIFVTYEENNGVIVPNKEEVEKIASIDIGLNNLCALTSNDPALEPIIINGRPLKSINQYMNKKISEMKSFLPKNIYTSKGINKIYQKRNHKIRDYLHKTSKFIIDYLNSNNIQCLVVGSNTNWKQGINIGKRNNQNFVNIPFNMLKSMLRYKCELNGILYIEREESYTSKCSFIDMESVEKQEMYLGKRTKRGLFISNKGYKINADINGSYNILRKEFGNLVFKDIDMYKLHPKKVTLKE